ncbi:MAG TPA: hypothetical protein VE843_03580, partial [Ktedonobacteraceae bacterium]|nr:hypothetical protein [Ktedonobacteraceae bacterium]
MEKDCEPGTPPPPCDYITNAYGGATIVGVSVSPEFGAIIGGSGTVYYSGSHPLGYVYSATDFDGTHPLGAIGAGGIFESVDATGIRWDKNANVTTDHSGIRTIISATSPTPVTVEDPNGNEIIQASGGGQITDTFGRVIPVVPSGLGPPNGNSSNCPTGPLPVNSAYAWTIPGFAGGSTTYTFCFVQFQLNINLHTGGLSQHNIADQTIVKALQSIVLPNGQSWTFTYDTSSGILTQIKLPIGGSISYSSNIVQGCKENSATFPWNYMTTVGSRSVDANDGNGGHTWGYSGPVTQTVGALTTITRTVSDPLGNQDVYTMTPLGNTCSFYPTQVQK